MYASYHSMIEFFSLRRWKMRPVAGSVARISSDAPSKSSRMRTGTWVSFPFINVTKWVAGSRASQSAASPTIEDMRVIFYRPYGWAPALRLELTAPIAASQAWLSMVLEGIKRQVFSPAVTEPYPLFLADRMVKSLGSGVAVIEQTVAQQAVGFSPDTEATLLCL